MGSHRAVGEKHVSILDDHDHVFGSKLRFSATSASEHQVVAGVGMQLFTLGIPCIYYGTEQSLGGPEPAERVWLGNFGGDDRYLRETLFGAAHPLRQGRDGLALTADRFDPDLPGFGPFGTAGQHCFDAASPAYTRIRHLAATRAAFPVLRCGRQYLRPVSFFGRPFDIYPGGEIIAWSRILDDEEVLVVLNPHGGETRGANVLVDARLNPAGNRMTVIASTEQAGSAEYQGDNGMGSEREIKVDPSGIHYVEIRDLGPSEFVLLANHANG